MSKGLGKIEKLILTYFKLARHRGEKPKISVFRLAGIVNVHTPTHSQYTSVCRAVESLRRKEYVKTEIQKYTNEYYDRWYGSRMGDEARNVKLVSIGDRMYEEKEWLKWYKRWDKNRKLY